MMKPVGRKVGQHAAGQTERAHRVLRRVGGVRRERRLHAEERSEHLALPAGEGEVGEADDEETERHQQVVRRGVRPRLLGEGVRAEDPTVGFGAKCGGARGEDRTHEDARAALCAACLEQVAVNALAEDGIDRRLEVF